MYKSLYILLFGLSMLHVTALFVDIRGFTEYGTKRPAKDILGFLNFFYSTVADAIKRHGGLVGNVGSTELGYHRVRGIEEEQCVAFNGVAQKLVGVVR
jgi:hypothetical protein